MSDTLARAFRGADPANDPTPESLKGRLGGSASGNGWPYFKTDIERNHERFPDLYGQEQP